MKHLSVGSVVPAHLTIARENLNEGKNHLPLSFR
jgi:hypothetical protein